MGEYDCLRLNHQLCFPIYAASRKIIRRYKPLLDRIGLTYTQYIVMMVLWEEENVSVKRIGERLMLDSGTLTPLLEKLEERGLVRKVRSKNDERVVMVALTDEGVRLKDEAKSIPGEMGKCVNLTKGEAIMLGELLSKVLAE